MKGLVLPALIGLLTAPAAAQEFPDQVGPGPVRQEIRLAARIDAKPFIWWDKRSNAYRGLFWEICSTAVERAGYQFEPVPIDADQRAWLFKTGRFSAIETDGSVGLTEHVDLVCDPTTITLARMRWFGRAIPDPDERSSGSNEPKKRKEPDFAMHFEFSPIFFVANGSFVRQNERLRAPADEQVKWLSWVCSHDGVSKWGWLTRHCEESAGSGDHSEPKTVSSFGYLPPNAGNDFCAKKVKYINSLMDQNYTAASDDDPAASDDDPAASDNDPIRYLPPTVRTRKGSDDRGFYEVWGFVSGSTIGQSIEDTKREVTGKVEICTRPLTSHEEAAREFCKGRLFRYFGDVELVKAAIADYEASSGRNCETDLSGSRTGTYEPYALVVSSERFPELPERLALAIYGMFTDGTIPGYFNGQFGKDRQSDYLKILYRINGIPLGLPP